MFGIYLQFCFIRIAPRSSEYIQNIDIYAHNWEAILMKQNCKHILEKYTQKILETYVLYEPCILFWWMNI